MPTKKASDIASWVMLVVAVASLVLGIMTYLGVTPIKISSEEIKARINDIDARIDEIEVKIEQMKAQGEEVTGVESELNEAKLLNIEANHEWQCYNFDAAQEKTQEAEQKVVDLEKKLIIPPPPVHAPSWVFVLIVMGTVLLVTATVLIFRTRRV